MGKIKTNNEFEEIAILIEEARSRAFQKVNEELVLLYFNVGNIVSAKVSVGAWGENTVGELATFVQNKFTGFSGFTRRGLYRMKQFYEVYSSAEFVSPIATQLEVYFAGNKEKVKCRQCRHKCLKRYQKISWQINYISWWNNYLNEKTDMNNTEKIYHQLLQPSDTLVADIGTLKGDIIILGAGGKMGPALARLAKQATELAGVKKCVIAVSRFSEKGLKDELNSFGIETHEADLLQDDQLNALPEADNILYLAGTKFGTTGNEPFTWAMNAYLPGRVAQKYKNSRIVVFSTGNVYPLTPVSSGGADETTTPQPIGEYAQSCLGRERLFQYYSAKNNTPVLIYRLNYANDVTYGVLLEIAKSVKEKRPIDLRMGYVNVIWQGDANEIALRALHHCAVPPKILNVTGAGSVSVRWLANEFGKFLGQTPEFINSEEDTALLSNAEESCRLFGKPKISLQKMIEVIVAWLSEGGKTINKPTHFQERSGQF